MKSTGLTYDEILAINKIFSKYPQIEEVILYGSRAKGNFKNTSDIDLSLVGKEIDLSLQTDIEFDLDDLMLPYKFDISIYDRISNPELLDHIKKVGKKFYENKNTESKEA